MSTQNKFIKISSIIIIIIVVATIGFWIIVREQWKEPKKGGREDKKEKVVLHSQIIETKIIESNGERFPRFIPQEGTELIIAPYQYTFANEELLESYGVLVFKYIGNEIKKIDKIEYEYGTGCSTLFSEEEGVRDLNNDGVKELIIDVSCRGGRGFSIYVWISDSLKLISPVDPKEGNLFGITRDNDFKLIDIDNDGKIEASFLRRDYVRLGPGPDDIRIDVYKRIYKWDGTEKPYYLWQEEKIGEEKPESIEP